MTQIGYPLAGTQVTTPQDWSNMAQNWLGTGVLKGKLNELLVYADSTGMQCKVKIGQAFIQGHFFQSNPDEVILPIANADSTNPRIDRIIVRLDYTSDSIQLAVLQGIPATTPTAPALTQNNTRWEISLAQVYVGANVSTIAAGNITDERYYVSNLNYANYSDVKWNPITTQNGWVFYGDVGSSAAPQAYWKDSVGIVHVKGIIKSGTATNGTVLFNLPAGYRPKEIRYFGGFDGAGVCQRLELDPNGDVKIASGSGSISNAFLTLDLIQFPAEQ